VYLSTVQTFVMVALIIASGPVWSHRGDLNAVGCHNKKNVSKYNCHSNEFRSSPLCAYSGSYNRSEWKFRSSLSPVSELTVGWYTGVSGGPTDVDHVVSLKDAYLSGGYAWSVAKKSIFSNDPLNHVASVPYVNRTLKNANVPLLFIEKVQASSYMFARGKCAEYVDLYVMVKQTYGLSFSNNDISAAKAECD
jgi:hypothetical protein